MRATRPIRSIAFMLAPVFLWVLTIGPGLANQLPETRTFDAQIAPGVLERSEPSNEGGPLGDRIQALIPDAENNCLRITDQSVETRQEPRTHAQHHLQASVQLVRESEIGVWLVRTAAAHNVTVCLDHATKLEAHYRSHLRLLGLNARLGAAGRVVFLAHELAHVPQHPRFSNNRRFSPEDMLLLQQVREAAAEAVATRVLWQLKQKGISAPWQAKLATAYYDIAKNFEAAMADGEGLVRELWATRSAFHHWFVADWRREIYDDLMFKTLARIAKDPIGLIPSSRQLSDQYLRGVADYAGQSFLIGGDGQALIENFRARGLPANSQARLKAILTGSETTPEQALYSLESGALSAVSQSPMADDE
ncbi:MAG: DUF6782 family putative metallopeptidase [Pseudomonadota bacterium]